MQAKDAENSAPEQQRQQHVAAESPVGQGHVAGSEWVEQGPQEPQLMLMLVALGIVQQQARGQAEHADQLHQWKPAAGLLAAGLGISPLVFRSVGQADGGAVDDLGAQAVPEWSGFFPGASERYP